MDEKLKYLTPQDVKAIGDFLQPYASRFFPPTCPLYHYTTGENLIRIIESQELWATQLSCVNDTTELVYAAGELCRRVTAKLSGANRETALFLQRLFNALSNPGADTSAIFVSCFSERRDDLSQWRAYSGGEGGYAIQFDPIKLLISENSPEILHILMRVEYKAENHAAMLDDVLAWGERCFVELEGAQRAPSKEAWADEFVTYWLEQLVFLAPGLKNPKFENEREWRLVYPLHPDDVKLRRMHFRQRQSMMTRHVALRVAKPLPITGVLVGPSRHPQLSRVAVGDLLKTAGYDPDAVKVEITEVPYRAA